MFQNNDTIVAIATAMGRGALAVVRLSGRDALRIAEGLWEARARLVERVATVVRLVLPGRDGRGCVRDRAMAVWFAGPRSATGEDVVEISVHGSSVIAEGVVEGAVRSGARRAERGEFTLRAFLNGKLDLAQAEAVADLVAASTPMQARAAFDQLEGTLSGRIAAIERRLFAVVCRLEAALDFPEDVEIGGEGVLGEVRARLEEVSGLLGDGRRGRVLREGATVVVLGEPNVGKSSLFNRMVGAARAIVGEAPGTTRDLVSEEVELLGRRVRLVDTAGLRVVADEVEREGVQRALEAARAADVVLVVLDATRRDEGGVLVQTEGMRRVVVRNKVDLVGGPGLEQGAVVGVGAVDVSALTGLGVAEAVEKVVAAAFGEESEVPRVSNARHLELLERAEVGLREVSGMLEGAGEEAAYEVVAAELRGVCDVLGQVTGGRTSEELLEGIFSRFCIGK